MPKPSTAQIGGKGTVRRKVKRHSQPGQNQTKQLQDIMKKMNANEIQKKGTVNLYKDNGKVMTSETSTVSYSQQGHVFSISGGKWSETTAQDAELTPDAAAALKKLTESYQATTEMQKEVADIPDLVEDAAQLD